VPGNRAGIVPLREFPSKRRLFKPIALSMEPGIVPSNWLSFSNTVSRVLRSKRPLGIDPVMALTDRSMSLRLVSAEKESRIVPCMRLPLRFKLAMIRYKCERDCT
jgi:hypothetical protein